MKLSHRKGPRLARTLCLLALPLAAAASQLPNKTAPDGAAWLELALNRQADALAALGILSSHSPAALRRMNDRQLTRVVRRTLDTELLSLLHLLGQVEPGRLLSAVYRYGPPPSVHALESLLAQESQALGWRHYVAEMSWLTARSVHGGGTVPRYSHLLRAAPEVPPAGMTAHTLAQALQRKGGMHDESQG